MTGLDWLIVGTFAFVAYTSSGFAGKHLYWFFNRRVIRGDQTGNISGRNRMGTFQINGRSYTGNNITMVDGRIIVDGNDVTGDYDSPLPKVVEIKITGGDIENLITDASVTCENVTGFVEAGGSVTCQNVGDNVDAGGSVTCKDVQGDVDAGGSVNCGKVGGSIDAGGSVRHG